MASQRFTRKLFVSLIEDKNGPFPKKISYMFMNFYIVLTTHRHVTEAHKSDIYTYYWIS